ncbi:hypothetical protein D3P08_14850 [Paenibacillus nanensis]|uniref:Adenosylcobinamide amidohydrolase n=1 Tax=Paenibacillus nanensis TaxID=393251 RepID=A0A3A1UT35_9BACL|nr:adenosylcobinamide amidohydrolase [Paenibacillus nanensis]RIX51699.1 hypothetical protein D3P08_14850 [Paenibacillus nanensis]
MAQPFRKGSSYQSELWQGLELRLMEDRIAMKAPGELYTLSSAVLSGGFSRSSVFVNWKVPLHYDCSDPVSDLLRQCRIWGYNPSETVGLITAAKLTHASVIEKDGDKFRLICCTTAGTRNAAKAGSPRTTFSAYTAGTINTMLVIEGAMTMSAMVNAVMTATEAKAAALWELGIRDSGSGELATGTTSDAIVIGVSQTPIQGAVHAYAGTATTIGCAIGEAVYESVLESAGTQQEV